MQKIKKFSLFVVCLMLVFSASLMFVGCGKNDNKIRLNEVTHSIFYAPLYVALNMGFFEEEGLEYDEKRTSFLEQYGLTVIRVANNMINKQFRVVCEYIDNYVRQIIQSPQSPDGASSPC